MQKRSVSLSVHIRLVLTMMFWGGTFVAGRLLAEELHPVIASSLRFVTASVMLLAVILIRDKSLPLLSRKQFGAMALLGLTGVFLYNIFFFTGLQTVEAGRASMIIATNPVITAFLAMFLLGERYSFSRSLGMLISVSGALIVISRGHPADIFLGDVGGMGEFYIVGCALSWSAYTLIGKLVLKNIEPLVAVAYSCTAGAIFLCVTALFSGHLQEVTDVTLTGAGCIFYFAFFGTTLGFSWFYDGVRKLGASRAAMYVNLVPISGILLGIVLLGEHLDSSLFIGGVLVFIGLYFVNRRAG